MTEDHARQPGMVVGPYRLDARLGQGGFSEVWKAIDGEGQLVALKLPTHPRFIQHLRQEKIALAEIRHPHLVRELAFEPHHDPPYLAMEYVEGENLRQAIAAEEGGFTVHQVVTVSDQVLDALQAIHDAGFIHRDLKPENILVTRDGTAKVIDLGLGRLVAELMAEVHVSLSMVSIGPVEGTLAYMSPEQKWGGQITPASDLYSFGVILFEMLTGQLPRGMETVSDLADVAPRFDLILRQALQEDPARRHPSATKLRERIGIVRRERKPVPLPCAPPVDPAEEVSLRDEAYLEQVSPYQEGDTIGHYTLVALLGRGGFGEVWKVEADGLPLALKVPLGPASRGKLSYEAELSGRLDHPRIPRPVEVQLTADPPHLVYPFVAGRSLRAVLNERGRLPLSEAQPMLAELAELIAYCHAQRIVHRDLKPENILLSQDGMPYLLDFGLGRAEGQTERMARIEVSLASARGKVGTFDYMAPEQRAGEQTGPPADLYAFGVLAYEVLAGCLPVGVDSMIEQASDVPHALQSLLRRLLSRDPQHRDTAESVATNLRRITPSRGRALLSRGKGGINWGVVVMATMAASFLLSLGWMWLEHPPSRYATATITRAESIGDDWEIHYTADIPGHPQGMTYVSKAALTPPDFPIKGQISPGTTFRIAYHWTTPANQHPLWHRQHRTAHTLRVSTYRLTWGTILACFASVWLAFYWRRI